MPPRVDLAIRRDPARAPARLGQMLDEGLRQAVRSSFSAPGPRLAGTRGSRWPPALNFAQPFTFGISATDSGPILD